MSDATITPIIVLKGLAGNAPTHFEGLQAALASHTEFLKVFWWVLFVATISFVTIRHVIVPLVRRHVSRN